MTLNLSRQANGLGNPIKDYVYNIDHIRMSSVYRTNRSGVVIEGGDGYLVCIFYFILFIRPYIHKYIQ